MPEPTGDTASPLSSPPSAPVPPGDALPPEEPATLETAPPAGGADPEGTSPPEPPAQVGPVTPEPPRPLPAGAFLAGSFEIKQVLLRGATNFYLADAGDWGQSDLRFVGERLAPQERQTPLDGPEGELFPGAERFIQDGREYAVWPLPQLMSLQEWRPAPNDDTLLAALRPLAQGLSALEAAGLRPHLEEFWSGESLFIDSAGQLRYYGFFDPVPEGQADPASQGETEDSSGEPAQDSVAASSALHTLAQLSQRLVRKNLSQSATLRLDDEFASLPFAEETKTFLRKLTGGHFPSISAAARELETWRPLEQCATDLLTDVGQERELNEDCGLVLRLSRASHYGSVDLDLLAVADGMGGHEGGEVASALALQALQTNILARLELNWHDNAQVRSALLGVLDEVNGAVVRLNEDPPYAALRNKPGSTLVFALRAGNRLFVGNAGDSRAYRWTPGAGLTRLTRDHSYVQDLIDSGRLAPEDAWHHPDSSVITSHIGMPRGFHRELFQYLAAPGDRFFLVSDGVVDMLRDGEIESIVAAAGSPRELAQNLVWAANEAGGVDNITVAALFAN